MKYFVWVVLILSVLSQLCIAGLPPTSVQGLYDASPQTKFNFQVPYNQKTDLGGIKALFETGNKNLILNPSFENTSFLTSWTSSAGVATVDTTNIEDGKQAASVALTAVNGAFLSQSVTPSVQLNSIPMVSSCWVKTSSANVQVCALQGGSEITCVAASSSNTWSNIIATTTGPASGSVGVDVKTTSSTTATVVVDDCYVGVSPPNGISSASIGAPVAASYFVSVSSASFSANVPVNFDTKIYDTNNAVTTGSSWKFTAPNTGYYYIMGIFNNGGTNANYLVYKNGSSYTYISTQKIGNNGIGPAMAATLFLNSGDFVDVRPDNSTGANCGNTAPYLCRIDINQVK